MIARGSNRHLPSANSNKNLKAASEVPGIHVSRVGGSSICLAIRKDEF